MKTFVHNSAQIDHGVHVGEGTKIWHFCHVMDGAVIGKSCVLGQNVFIGKGVVIGNGVKIQNNVSIYEGVSIEDDVFLGPSCVFTNVINPRSFVERKNEYRQTIVRRGASIGANATIICGNEIGAYAMIGAAAVVTKDVAAYSLVKGNPAVWSSWVSRLGHKLDLNAEGIGICPESGELYRLVNGILIQE